MFTPRYTITDQLLLNITRINRLVSELNNRQFPRPVLVELERNAREVSVYASTSIEGNPLPLTEVKRVLRARPENLRDSEKEVINYNRALEWLQDRLNTTNFEIDPDLVLEIHRKVMDGLLPNHECGRWRQKPVVVNDPRTGSVVYLPPDHDQVKGMMSDLIRFTRENYNKVDPLILAGIFHKQMVIIHPFMDGNGRTTRLAVKVLLARMGLNTFNLFSFENYYNRNVTRYFETVGEFGNYYDLAEKVDFSGWLEYFSAGLIDELMRVEKLLPHLITSPETRLEPQHLKILEIIKQDGFINDRTYATVTQRAKATRTLDFQRLMELELIERKGGGRSTYYVLNTGRAIKPL